MYQIKTPPPSRGAQVSTQPYPSKAFQQPLRFTSTSSQGSWLNQTLSRGRKLLETGFQRMLDLWDDLALKLETLFIRLHRFFMPAVPQLRESLLPLLKQAPTGLSPALVRAKLLEHDSSNALLPLAALRKDLMTTAPKKLLNRFVENESDAYLASHLMALESAIKSPGTLISSKNLPPQLRLGVEDAQAVVSRRVTQPFYGKDNNGVADSLYQLILESPKVALHEHYRGSAPMAMVRAKFIDDGHPKAYQSNDVLEEYCRMDRLFTHDGKRLPIEPDLNLYRSKLNQISVSIYSEDTAYLGAYMYTLRSGLENVRYFEYRLNPLSKNVKDPIRYIQAIQQGLEDAKAFLWETRQQKIDSNIILTADRQPKEGVKLEPEPGKPYDARVSLALKVLDVAIEARQKGLKVTGFDIAGDETGYAITDFKPVGDRLKAYNKKALEDFRTGKTAQDLRIGATIHAGETPVSGTISHPQNPLTGHQSVEKAIELFWDENTPMRIGHGIRIMYQPKLIQLCKERNIGLEQCPKSNVQTRAVNNYSDLPTLTLSRHYGLKVSLSCDNRTTSKTNTCNELVKVTRHLGARHEDRKRFQTDGLETAFIFDPAKKQAIMDDLLLAYQKLEQDPMHQDIIRQEKDPASFKALVENISQKQG